MKKKEYTIITAFACVLLLMGACAQPTSDSENQTLKTIFNRKSVRSYTSRPVENEKLQMLVRAGMAAPSSRDRRPWEFIIVTDRHLLDSMAEKLPFARMLKDTKQAIVVCGDTVKSDNSWYLDCSAATQNILLAAESMGIGAVWTAAYPYPDRMDAVKQTLNLPAHILPLTVIPLGYPSVEDMPKDKFNEKQIHYNRW